MVALLAGSASVDTRDEGGKTSLFTAAERGMPKTVDALLAAVADGSVRDSSGQAAFSLAFDNDKLKGTDAYWRLSEARLK